MGRDHFGKFLHCIGVYAPVFAIGKQQLQDSVGRGKKDVTGCV